MNLLYTGPARAVTIEATGQRVLRGDHVDVDMLVADRLLDQEGWLLAASHIGDGHRVVDGATHVGGGWYELPDGTRVQGRDAAEEALAAVAALPDAAAIDTADEAENGDTP